MISVCLFIIGMIPAEGLSPSYYKKFAKSIPERAALCVDLYTLAEREQVDPLLVLAVASMESGFLRNQVSSAGARGPLGVMPSNMRHFKCPKRGCRGWDYAIRGVQILREIEEDAHESGVTDRLCMRLSKYNAGNKGSCKGVGGKYAKLVISRYEAMHAFAMNTGCNCP